MNIIERLKELQAVATPGPWRINYSDVGDEEYIDVPGGIIAENGFHVVSEEGGLCDLHQAWTVETLEANADLIVTLRNNAEALLELAEAVKLYKEMAYENHANNYARMCVALAKLEAPHD